MKLEAFFDAVEAADDLVGLGLDEQDFYVQHTVSKMITRIPLDYVEMQDWSDLYPVLRGDREPVVLNHMTRVVGYFSRVDNWNKSKVGELKDRHKGDYAIR